VLTLLLVCSPLGPGISGVIRDLLNPTDTHGVLSAVSASVMYS